MLIFDTAGPKWDVCFVSLLKIAPENRLLEKKFLIVESEQKVHELLGQHFVCIYIFLETRSWMAFIKFPKGSITPGSETTVLVAGDFEGFVPKAFEVSVAAPVD